jgi:cystathionine beta-synthase
MIPRMEGIFVGNSAGAAIAGLLQMRDRVKSTDLIVVIFHDHGTRYLGKMFNEDWMKERGFIDPPEPKTALDLIKSHAHKKLVTVKAEESIESAFVKMQKYDISQIPVSNSDGELIGSLCDSGLFSKFMTKPELRNGLVKDVIQAPFPMVHYKDSVETVSKMINKDKQAVLVTDLGGNVHIITKYDIIDALR